MGMQAFNRFRREWGRATLGLALSARAAPVTLAGMGLVSAPARALALAEGVDFKTLARPQTVEVAAGKIEVIEFFGYWCPHCHALEPDLQAWRAKQAADVVLRKLPVAFRPNQAPFQHAYFALEALGKADATASAIFGAIHTERKTVESIDDLAEIVVKAGVDRAKFLELAGSFAIQAKARRVAQVAEAFAIDGVPCLAVAGKWITSPSLAGSRDKALSVVDELIARERRKTR
jgi:thiol:disulfide interchange protein DsbA